jgi:hypothetical protein
VLACGDVASDADGTKSPESSSGGPTGSVGPSAADGGSPAEGGDSAVAGAAGDPYKAVFDAVDKASLEKMLKDATGTNPVTVDGKTYNITERWSVAGKAGYRAFFKQFFTARGATVNELTFKIPNMVGETLGHNMEAVLPGASADSLVIIVHYDTVGITGKEKQNPGVDDDGSGIASMMEAGRIFSQIKDRKNTVRFVAADYEEISDNLDGDIAYVKYLQAEAAAKKFKIIAASDNDQTGWSCWDEDVKLCGTKPPPANTSFQLITCSGDKKNYDYPDLAKGFLDVASAYSTMKPTAMCDGSGDTDHYPFWVAGIPAYVIEEYGSENNPHYDDTGNDTMKTINMQYLFQISQIQIAFQAKLMGIGP